MAQAKNGDTVRVHYTLKLEGGATLVSTPNENPLQFTIGDGKIMQGFEEAVVGMNPGESKTVQVPAGKAFGPHLDEMVVVVDRRRLPADFEPTIGEQLQLRQSDGGIILLRVIDLSEENVTLDANHPLAGKDLTFDIQFIEVV